MKVGNLPLPHRGGHPLHLINEKRTGVPIPKAAGNEPRQWETIGVSNAV